MKIFNRLSLKKNRQRLRNEMSEPEQMLWYYIRDRQIHGVKFRRQHSIGSFIVDFYCPETGMVIELDGDSHFEEGIQKNDMKRDTYMIDLGLMVLRFTNDDIRTNMDGVIEKIQEEIVKRSNPSQPPLGKGRRIRDTV